MVGSSKDLSSVTSLGLAWPAAKQHDANDDDGKRRR